MTYPIINGKELDGNSKALFRSFKKVLSECINRDNKRNAIGLSKKDIELLVWNAAVEICFVTRTIKAKAEKRKG